MLDKSRRELGCELWLRLVCCRDDGQGVHDILQAALHHHRGNNVYGPHQFLEKLVPNFTLLARRGDPLPVHGAGQVSLPAPPHSPRAAFLKADVPFLHKALVCALCQHIEMHQEQQQLRPFSPLTQCAWDRYFLYI